MIGHIDEPINNSTLYSDSICCTGWVYSSVGIKKVKIFIDGIEAGDAEYGIIRNDLKLVFPNYPGIEKSGFHFLMGKSMNWGVHRLQVKVFERVEQQSADLGEIVFFKFHKKNFLLKTISWILEIFFSKSKNTSPQIEKRQRIAKLYLFGDGIEIGALHNPLPLAEGIRVRYIDRVPLNELNAQYSEVDRNSIIKIDLVDNGEILAKIEDNSLNFIIANHFLEHCENPLGTIRNHLSKIKKGGILYYAIPEKNFTFDIDRPLTPFKHLIDDDIHGPSTSRKSHMQEWIIMIEKNCNIDEKEIEKRTRDLVSNNYSIHFHVWDIEAIFEFLYKTKEYLNNTFRVLHVEQNFNEIIVVLQKK